MVSRKTFVAAGLGLLAVAGVSYLGFRPARQASPPEPLLVEEKVIAGGPRDSIEVRHLVLTGTNEAIGQALARIARERYQAEPQPSQDLLLTRVQRQYIQGIY